MRSQGVAINHYYKSEETRTALTITATADLVKDYLSKLICTFT